ncbi:MAG: hypothetical protein M3384_00610 [Acidobacteriota bacterium]|nr:hypothetical protein [Acidobacteriota bacterium]
MKKRNVPQNKKTARVPRREGDPIPWRYCFLTLICGALLVGGFFLAARQHFTAIDYGIKNARLRQEKENLETQQQHIKLNREITLSPAEIRKAARKIGFREMTASNIDISSRRASSSQPAEKTKPEILSGKPSQPSESANKETAKIESRDEKKAAKTTKEETKKAETKTDRKKESAR